MQGKKVLHICTSIRGGAGIAARRLHEQLLESGVDSKILTLCDELPEKNIFAYTKPIFKKFYGGLKRLPIFFSKSLDLYHKINSIPGEYEIYSSHLTPYRVEENSLVQESDIIHLHWVADFINYPTFFSKLSKKKIFWTHHDINFSLGGFHYAGDKIRNPKMRYFEEANSKQKQECLRDVKISHISPSSWLIGELESQIGNIEKIRVIRNIIPKKSLPNNLTNILPSHFSEEKKTILFISESIYNPRKGFELADFCLKKLSPEKFQFLLIGRGNMEMTQENVHFTGFLSRCEDIYNAYYSSDLTIIPSKEDNLPNTMLESLLVGTPVLAFENGGMKEVIHSGVNGHILYKRDEQELVDFISQIDFNQFNRKKIRSKAEEDFTSHIDQFISYYIE